MCSCNGRAAAGIVSGSLENGTVLKYVKRSEDVQEGDRLITSGLDGVFPKGLMVGAVIKVRKQHLGCSSSLRCCRRYKPARTEKFWLLRRTTARQKIDHKSRSTTSGFSHAVVSALSSRWGFRCSCANHLSSSITDRPCCAGFVLVLCVYLGLHHPTVGAALGRFLLGYSIDVVSSRIIGLECLCHVAGLFGSLLEFASPFGCIIRW